MTKDDYARLREISVLDLAFPGMTAIGHQDFAPGLTKREYFAAMAMQGLIGNHVASQRMCDLDPRYDGNNFARVAALNAVEFADALLGSLDAAEGAT